MAESQDQFPCRLKINIPFPSSHLATTALRALRVDQELSSLVTRSFSLTSTSASTSETEPTDGEQEKTILVVLYAATTNRMLRVAVNGFLESLGVVLHCMEELDLDVIDGPVTQDLSSVQGIEAIET